MASKAQKKAANTAADTSLQVANQNNQLIRDTRNQNVGIAAPFYNNGVAAGNALNDLLLGPYHGGGVQTAPVANVEPVNGALSGYAPNTDFRAGLPARTDWANGALSAIGAPSGADPIASLKGAITHLNPMQQRAWATYLDSNPDPDTVYEQRQAAAQQASPVPSAPVAPASSQGGALDAFDRFRQGTNYQWRFNQGLNALTGQYATKGALDSGAAEKAKITYGQNLASGELSNYMNLLAGQQQVGLSAGNAVMGVSTGATNAITAQNTNAGNVAANAALTAGQANANMWGTVGSTAGQLGGALFQYGMGKMTPAPMVPNAQSINVSPTGTSNFFASQGGF